MVVTGDVRRQSMTYECMGGFQTLWVALLSEGRLKYGADEKDG